jgi:hypothetical protein
MSDLGQPNTNKVYPFTGINTKLGKIPRGLDILQPNIIFRLEIFPNPNDDICRAFVYLFHPFNLLVFFPRMSLDDAKCIVPKSEANKLHARQILGSG